MWRASTINHLSRSCLSRPGIPSGFAVLDDNLPDKGWPGNGLTELLHDRRGIGEMKLITPALAWLSQSLSRWIILISPPFIPYAPALSSQGIDLTKILVVNPCHKKDRLWALEKSLASACCSAVLAWPEQITDKDIRRLQLACKNGNSWGIIFRPASAAKQFSPAELRIQLQCIQLQRIQLQRNRLHGIQLQSDNTRLHLHILKRRGGWTTDIHLDLHHYEDEGRIMPESYLKHPDSATPPGSEPQTLFPVI